MASFRFVRDVAAPPDVVFEIFTDHRGYADITAARSSVLERQGDPPPNGVGAIRAIQSLGPPLREEVLTYEPPRRFSYTILSGAPLRDHLGTVEMTPQDGGTRIAYAVRLMPTLPVGGAAVVAAVRLAVRQLLKGVAAEAERRAATLHV
jgi:uncharacterized protein YndB with AHSA1/START domain